MSDDTNPPNGNGAGYLVLPRRVRLAAVITAISIATGAGGWGAKLHADTLEAKGNSQKAIEQVENVQASVRRVERYLCLHCGTEKSLDCSDICGSRRLEPR